MSSMFLTVGIPVYNGDKYIERCIYSVINSIGDKYKNSVEILIVDDGSKDNSVYKIKNIINGNPDINIKLLENTTNKGIATTRNKILYNSTSEKYIWFVDCDDYIYINSLDVIFNAIETSKDMYIFKYNLVGDNDKILKKSSAFDYNNNILYRNNNLKSFNNNVFKEGMFFEPGPCNKIINKNLFFSNNIKYLDGIIYEDLNVYPKLWLNSNEVEYIDKCLYNYYVSDNSITRNKKVDNRIDIVKSISDIIDYYKKNEKYEENKKELEYLTIQHINYIYNSVFDINYKSDVLDKLTNFINTTFPNWYNNEYFKQKSIRSRIRYFVQFKNIKWLLRLINKYL